MSERIYTEEEPREYEKIYKNTTGKVKADKLKPCPFCTEGMTDRQLTAQLNHVWAMIKVLEEALAKAEAENAVLREKLNTIVKVVKDE